MYLDERPFAIFLMFCCQCILIFKPKYRILFLLILVVLLRLRGGGTLNSRDVRGNLNEWGSLGRGRGRGSNGGGGASTWARH